MMFVNTISAAVKVFFLFVAVSHGLKLHINAPTTTFDVGYVPALFGHAPVDDRVLEIVVPQPASACAPLSPLALNGQSVAGRVVLIYGSGDCLLMNKALFAQDAGAAGVIIYACSPADFCDPTASVMLGLNGFNYSITSMMISYYDGVKIISNLGSNLSVNTTMPGSGVGFASDTAALLAVYTAVRAANNNQPLPFNGLGSPTFDPTGSLLGWEVLLANPNMDPCGANRLYGVFCVGGRVVSLNCYGCGFLGVLPTAIGDLTGLLELDFSVGNALVGVLPCSLAQLTSLRVLNMATNGVTVVGDCVGTLAELQVMDFTANALTVVPTNLGSMSTLTSLKLGGNRLTSIPALNDLALLTVLDLSNNKIVATLQSWTFSVYLVTIDLHANHFSGPFSHTQFDGLTMLKSIDASKNAMSGMLPQLLGCTSLTLLNFGFNQLSGVVPSNWNTFVLLKTATLLYNQLESPVTPFFTLPLLEQLDLSHNQLSSATGDPSFDGENGAFMYFLVGQGIKMLDLSNNQLSGLFSTGWLTAVWPNLLTFSVANNKIGGPLPSDIWQIASGQLGSLDFSGNKWSGALPQGSPPHSMSLNFANNPLLSNGGGPGVAPLPSFLAPSTVLVKDASGLFSCPTLVSSDAGLKIDAQLDPSYYEYVLCSCERGFTYLGLPPNCTAFPSVIRQTTESNTFTDGSSSGRLRTGVDTTWVVSPPGLVRAITLDIVINIDRFNAKATGQFAASYILSVSSGSTPTNMRQDFYFSSDTAATDAPFHTTVTVLSSSCLVRFLSNSQLGPIFGATFNASASCPSGFVLDSMANICVAEPENIHLSAGLKLGLALICFGILLVFAVFGGFMEYHKAHRAIHASSPAFLFVFLSGGVLLVLAVLTRSLVESTLACSAHLVLLNMGFSLAYGSLFAKTWRLHKIFNNKELSMTKITNAQLFSILGAWVLVDMLLMALWLNLSPYKIDPIAQNCVSNSGGAFTWVIIAIRGLQIAAGSYLTYECRALPSQFNESKFIAISIYNVVTLSALWLCVSLAFAASLSEASRIVFESAIALLGAASTISMVLLPKFLTIITDKGFVGVKGKSMLHAGGDKRSSVVSMNKISATLGEAGNLSSGQPIHRRASNLINGKTPEQAIIELNEAIKVKNAALHTLRAKAVITEENLQKVNDSVEDEERKIAEAYAEIEYINDMLVKSESSSSYETSQMKLLDNPTFRIQVEPAGTNAAADAASGAQ